MRTATQQLYPRPPALFSPLFPRAEVESPDEFFEAFAVELANFFVPRLLELPTWRFDFEVESCLLKDFHSELYCSG